MYGFFFDPCLHMEDAIHRLCSAASWKLNTILRSNRFFDTQHTVQLYKAKVLSFIEFRTSAIYHATEASLQRVNALQNRLLRSLDISERDAIEHLNLAPLQARRDIALLGVIHRATIGLGPEQFRNFFVLAPQLNNAPRNRHSKQIVSHRVGSFLIVLCNSLLGLTDVYNLLPEFVVAATTVKDLQKRLQHLALEAADNNAFRWM